MDEREPIRNVEAEMCALGCAFLSDQGFSQIAQIVKRDSFYQPSHKTIFDAMAKLKQANEPIDLVTVKSELTNTKELASVGGIDYLIQIAEAVPSATNAKSYATIVQKLYVRREIARRAEGLLMGVYTDEGYERAWQFVRDCGKGLSDGASSDYGLHEILDEIDEHDNNPEHKFGVPTGLAWIDDLSETKGLAIGEPVVIMAPTGGGKSALMTQIMLNMMRNEKTIGCATYEMTPEWLVRRFLKHISGWMTKPYSETALVDYEAAKDELRDEFMGRCHFFDPSASDDLTCTVEALARWHEGNDGANKVDCLCVDYAQLISSEKAFRSPVEELTHVTRVLSKAAKKTRSACIVLSQQNQDGDSSQSKELMKVASMILQISSDRSSIRVLKARHGKNGTVIPVTFNEKRLVFER